MDFHSMPRRELQALCKKNAIPANQTNVAMADALQALASGGEIEFSSPVKAVEPKSAPKTGRRTSTRQTTRSAVPAPGSPMPRSRRVTAGAPGVLKMDDEDEEEEKKESETPVVVKEATRTVGVTTRRRAKAIGVINDGESGAVTTRRSTRVKANAMKMADLAKEEQEVVKAPSVKEIEAKLCDLTIEQNEEVKCEEEKCKEEQHEEVAAIVEAPKDEVEANVWDVAIVEEAESVEQIEEGTVEASKVEVEAILADVGIEELNEKIDVAEVNVSTVDLENEEVHEEVEVVCAEEKCEEQKEVTIEAPEDELEANLSDVITEEEPNEKLDVSIVNSEIEQVREEVEVKGAEEILEEQNEAPEDGLDAVLSGVVIEDETTEKLDVSIVNSEIEQISEEVEFKSVEEILEEQNEEVTIEANLWDVAIEEQLNEKVDVGEVHVSILDTENEKVVMPLEAAQEKIIVTIEAPEPEANLWDVAIEEQLNEKVDVGEVHVSILDSENEKVVMPLEAAQEKIIENVEDLVPNLKSLSIDDDGVVTESAAMQTNNKENATEEVKATVMTKAVLEQASLRKLKALYKDIKIKENEEKRSALKILDENCLSSI